MYIRMYICMTVCKCMSLPCHTVSAYVNVCIMYTHVNVCEFSILSLPVSMYACMYVCTYVCVYVCMYVCIYVCMYVGMCVYTYVFMRVCMYACVCMYVYTYIHMYVCTHIECMFSGLGQGHIHHQNICIFAETFYGVH